MADENAGKEPENKDEQIAALKEQVENLNKGIAGYRDEAKSAKDEATKASQDAKEALSKLEEISRLREKKDDGFKLTEEDEKRLAAYAQKHGLVSKEDLEKQRSEARTEIVKSYENQAVTEFLEKHPEYNTDEKWKEVMTEYGVYRQPTTLQGFKQLLDRIHKDLSGEASKDAAAKARAELINRSKLGLGSGSGRSTEDGEEELERLVKKYPNLTREQILERRAEIAALPSKKK